MKYKLLPFILLITLITGCLGPSTDFTLRITPSQSILPIQGTWQIVSLLPKGSATDQGQEWLGEKLHFTENFALLGDYLVSQPTYQTRHVELPVYLQNNPSLPQDYPYGGRISEVITLTDRHLFSCDLLPGNDSQVLLALFNKTYLEQKLVDDSVFSSSKVIDIIDLNTNPNTQNKRSGVLLGLRAPDGNYRTLWIASANQELSPPMETDTIIFPRRSGFFELQIAEVREDKRKEDLLHVIPLSGQNKIEPPQSLTPDIWGDNTGSISRVIHYIGNDYVSIEEIIQFTDQDILARLKLLSVDSLPAIKAVTVSDLNAPGIIDQETNISPHETNFGMGRSKGYWVFRSRRDGRFPFGNNSPAPWLVHRSNGTQSVKHAPALFSGAR